MDNRASPSRPIPRHHTRGEDYITFKVTQAERGKKGSSFRFDVTTNLPNFKRTQHSAVERTYSELGKLRAHLVRTYPGVVIQALPKETAHTPTSVNANAKQTVVHIGPTAQAAGPTHQFNSTSFEEELLVKDAVQLFLTRVASHPVLRNDYELREFVETPFLFNPSTLPTEPSKMSTTFLPFTSGRKSRHSFPQALHDPQEIGTLEVGSEPWYDTVGSQLTEYETDLGPTRKAAARVGRKRKVLAELLQELAMKNVAISVTESDEELSFALRRTGNLFHRVSEIQQLQAEHASMRMDYFLDWYERSAECVLDAITNRKQMHTEFDHLNKRTERRRQNIMALKSASSIHTERADQALEEYEQAKSEQSTQSQFLEVVNDELPCSIKEFENQRVQDTLLWLRNLSKRHLEFEKQQLAELERILQLTPQTHS
ncbi:Vacuolar protein sorting-associated protein 17 [Dispira parvispora]|uniref:Vacuolar protein sorting-associated protein 17 n=1 Tax=Dispira parvispora TaxID=1520584 RepID=A0A9W8AY80_9FUNG|nr:Vacuolar protein sorting-associated protein 17 [Dispira parvispora]